MLRWHFSANLTIGLPSFDFRSRSFLSLSNAIEHQFGFAGINGCETLGERAVDLGEFIVGYCSSIAIRQKSCELCTASQEKRTSVLDSRALHGAPEAAFRLHLVVGCQSEIALEQVETGVDPMLRIALGGSAGFGKSDDRVLKPLRSALKVSKDSQIIW